MGERDVGKVGATASGADGRSPSAAPSRPVDPRHTGRHVVLLKDGGSRAAAERLRNATGLRMSMSSDFDGRVRGAHTATGEGVMFERLGVALLHGDPDQVRALAKGAGARKLIVEPERIVRVSGPWDDPLADSEAATWGLQATRVASSRFSGQGVRVAILDTGIDLQHPDFAGRAIVSQSFVAGGTVADVFGHGTQCAGVACGPLNPGRPPRYGVAPDAEIYVGKVVGDDGSGTDGDVLAGIDWAVGNGCAVICMALGTTARQGEPHSQVYEQVAARSLAAGSVLVAAAGNQSQRPDTIVPVDHPADCPSILSVGAVDPHLGIAVFSNGGRNPDGGEVDIAAPGVAILSCWPGPALYQAASGTSMAAPHVAGILALLAEADPAARGQALRALLLRAASGLPLPAGDVGAGLAQAPQ